MKIILINPILRTAETDNIPQVTSIKDCLAYGFCKALKSLGHDVTLLAAKDFAPSELEDYDFNVIFMPSAIRTIFRPRLIPFLPSLWKHLYKNTNYDLIISSEIFSISSLIAAITVPKKTVIWHELAIHPNMLYQIPSRIWYFLTSPIYSRVKNIYPRSSRAKIFLQKYFKNVSEIIIGNGVDQERFQPTEAKNDTFIVCSQLVTRKRVDRTIEMFRTYLHEYPQATESLVIVGDGVDRSKLETMVHESGISHRIQFVGRLPHAKMAPLLAGSKALLVSSLKDNILMSVQESVLCGTPVVITAAIDNADDVRRYRLGIVDDNWNQQTLHQIKINNESYVKNCHEHRNIFSHTYNAENITKTVNNRF